MMKRVIIFLCLIASVALTGCVGCGKTDAPPPWKNQKGNLNKSPSTDPLNFKTTNDSTDYNSTNIQNSEEVFSLTALKTNNIASNQIFNYSNLPIPNSSYEFKFQKEGNNVELNVILKENGFNWENVFSLVNDLKSEWRMEGITYSGEVVDNYKITYPLSIKIDNNNQVEKVQLGQRTFTKKPAPNSTQTEKLTYLDNHTVVVQPGQTLRKLVDMYNKENYPQIINKKVSVAEICLKNPSLGSRCVVKVGDTINF